MTKKAQPKVTLEVATINWSEPPPKRMHAIAGNDSAKRALEVVLAGEHKVVILATVRSPASDLLRAAANIAKANGIPFSGMVVPVCPCGAYGNPKEECDCSSAALLKYARKLMPMVKKADIIIETVEPQARDTARFNENEELMAIRILKARKTDRLDTSVMPSDAEELLRMAIKEYGASRDKTVAVAATVARLGGCDLIEISHITEALQYQYPAYTRWFDDFEQADVSGS